MKVLPLCNIWWHYGLPCSLLDFRPLYNVVKAVLAFQYLALTQ